MMANQISAKRYSRRLTASRRRLRARILTFRQGSAPLSVPEARRRCDAVDRIAASKMGGAT